ncbi:hypothetical protein BRARA_G03462 [Brassica rapa]|uniref:Hydroxyproline-rich glycoprotein family protein n=1 Tax=Brassica campestris TaxID=3711 RepID=A0A397YS45_BRACM|nr:hypothetical protein BRARA_G03462 [Brassica rapa]
MGSEQHRFLQQQEQRKRWGGCLRVFSCFKSQKGGKRIVPASRIPEGGNPSASQPNGPHQPGGVLTNQANLSYLAPPSSPASFTNSALPSTAQSPNNSYLSLAANSSPSGPSSSMYATGPYAHETQLVSPPPVFSTFTTEPSTAPFTPPPELAHLTTPSSPDVPYARFLTSNGKGNHYNDLHSTYSLYPGSPASAVSRASGVSTPLQESNFFCPETFAKFYQDHDPQNGGRLSVSKDSDVYPSGNVNRQTRQDMEELEAYRASFGFSADEVVTTSQYVEINDVMDESLLKPAAYSPSEGQKLLRREASLLTSTKSETDHKPRNGIHADEEALLSRVGSVKGSRSYPTGFSSSDAEVEYRRGRSLREGREIRHRR